MKPGYFLMLSRIVCANTKRGQEKEVAKQSRMTGRYVKYRTQPNCSDEVWFIHCYIVVESAQLTIARPDRIGAEKGLHHGLQKEIHRIHYGQFLKVAVRGIMAITLTNK